MGRRRRQDFFPAYASLKVVDVSLENLVTAQVPRLGRQLFQSTGVIKVDFGDDAAAVSAIGWFQASMRKLVALLQQRARVDQITSEVVTSRLPRDRIARKCRKRGPQRLKRLAAPMLLIQYERAGLIANLVAQAQRRLHRRMEHALTVPSTEAGIIGINANS